MLLMQIVVQLECIQQMVFVVVLIIIVLFDRLSQILLFQINIVGLVMVRMVDLQIIVLNVLIDMY